MWSAERQCECCISDIRSPQISMHVHIFQSTPSASKCGIHVQSTSKVALPIEPDGTQPPGRGAPWLPRPWQLVVPRTLLNKLARALTLQFLFLENRTEHK